MDDNPLTTPMIPSLELHVDLDLDLVDPSMYIQLIRSLMYLVNIVKFSSTYISMSKCLLFFYFSSTLNKTWSLNQQKWTLEMMNSSRRSIPIESHTCTRIYPGETQEGRKLQQTIFLYLQIICKIIYKKPTWNMLFIKLAK